MGNGTSLGIVCFFLKRVNKVPIRFIDDWIVGDNGMSAHGIGLTDI